eukprot:944432-Amphidinium_carterae.1
MADERICMHSTAKKFGRSMHSLDMGVWSPAAHGGTAGTHGIGLGGGLSPTLPYIEARKTQTLIRTH